MSDDPIDPPNPLPDADAPRERHDGFTHARRGEFLQALGRTGSITDACRKIGVSPRTVYRHQENDPHFLADCAAALRMSAQPVELTAWQRAVEGIEEPFVAGGQVHHRRRYSDGLLRLLLQGSNPKKYGPRPGFTRKRVLKHERKQMERELRHEIGAKFIAIEEDTVKALAERLRAFGHRSSAEEEQARLAEGWTRSPDGHWIPPGYAPISHLRLPAAAADRAAADETPHVSM